MTIISKRDIKALKLTGVMLGVEVNPPPLREKDDRNKYISALFKDKVIDFNFAREYYWTFEANFDYLGFYNCRFEYEIPLSISVSTLDIVKCEFYLNDLENLSFLDINRICTINLSSNNLKKIGAKLFRIFDKLSSYGYNVNVILQDNGFDIDSFKIN